MNYKESKPWFDAMKDEMSSKASNGVWDLVELPNGVRTLDVSGSLRPRKTH